MTRPADEQNLCDTCDKPWEVLFEWDYTGPERYCTRHLTEPLEYGSPGSLLDFMPDCQRITHRVLSRKAADQGRETARVNYTSTAMLTVALTGRPT